MAMIRSVGFLLLVVTQVTVNGVPVNELVQKIGSPVAEENDLFHQEESPVQLGTLSEFGKKYSIENVTFLTQSMRDGVNMMRNGEQGYFLRSKLGNNDFHEIEVKFNNSLAESDTIKREAIYLNGKRLQPHVMLLRRLIKRLANMQRSLSDSFKDLSARLRTASVGSTGFAEGIQLVLLQVFYEYSSFLYKTSSEEAEHDWRSLANLEAV